jgi:predicted PurR-regulated permease PerM
MVILELAAAVYLATVLWPLMKRLRLMRFSLPPIVRTIGLVIVVLIILLNGFRSLFMIR